MSVTFLTNEDGKAFDDRLKAVEKNGGGGGVSAEQVQAAVNSALEQAKLSGEFDGEVGPQGPAGADGKDYILTDADKQEIATYVIAAIPRAEGVGF